VLDLPLADVRTLGKRCRAENPSSVDFMTTVERFRRLRLLIYYGLPPSKLVFLFLSRSLSLLPSSTFSSDREQADRCCLRTFILHVPFLCPKWPVFSSTVLLVAQTSSSNTVSLRSICPSLLLIICLCQSWVLFTSADLTFPNVQPSCSECPYPGFLNIPQRMQGARSSC
jgi:hypothetical protein